MSIAIDKQLRAVIADIYNDEGEQREKVKFNFISPQVSEEAIVLLKEILVIVMSKDYFHEITKYHLVDNVIDRATLAAKHNQKASTTQTRIYRDMKKFKKDFGEKSILDIATNPNADLTYYRKKVNEFSGTLKSFYDSVDLDLTGALGAFAVTVDKSEFDDACKKLNLYTKAYKDRVVKGISQEVFGYINYLFSKEDRTIEEEEQYNRLLAIAGKLSFSSIDNINLYREIGYTKEELPDVQEKSEERSASNVKVEEITDIDKMISDGIDSHDIMTDVDDVDNIDAELEKDLKLLDSEDDTEVDSLPEGDDDDDFEIDDEELEKDLRGEM